MFCKIQDVQDLTTSYSSWIQDPQDPAEYFLSEIKILIGSHDSAVVKWSIISKIPWENENIRSNIPQDPESWILEIQDPESFLGSRHMSASEAWSVAAPTPCRGQPRPASWSAPVTWPSPRCDLKSDGRWRSGGPAGGDGDRATPAALLRVTIDRSRQLSRAPRGRPGRYGPPGHRQPRARPATAASSHRIPPGLLHWDALELGQGPTAGAGELWVSLLPDCLDTCKTTADIEAKVTWHFCASTGCCNRNAHGIFLWENGFIVGSWHAIWDPKKLKFKFFQSHSF